VASFDQYHSAFHNDISPPDYYNASSSHCNDDHQHPTIFPRYSYSTPGGVPFQHVLSDRSHHLSVHDFAQYNSYAPDYYMHIDPTISRPDSNRSQQCEDRAKHPGKGRGTDTCKPIEYVTDILPSDVLSGRGGATNR
jgi:hypothetical protein